MPAIAHRVIAENNFPSEINVSLENLARELSTGFLLVALRTLKSEIAVGLKPEVIQELAKSDSCWLTNGQWGVTQLVA